MTPRERLAATIATIAVVFGLVACGTAKPPPVKPVRLPPSVKQACPQALHAKGAMGECTPPQVPRAKAAK